MIEIWSNFPGTTSSLCIQRSPKDADYNCIAFAMQDKTQWWWPTRRKGFYWPANAPLENSIGAFAAMVAQFGYSICQSELHEAGFEKIALFARGMAPKHLARQIPNGNWVSKMGGLEDIEHELRAIEGDNYGKVARIFRKPY